MMNALDRLISEILALPRGIRVVLADPPWLFRSNSLRAPGRNARRHYACLTVDELCRLPLAERLAKDAALFLWVPGPFLVIGAHVPLMKAWGFEPTARAFAWAKLNHRANPTLFTSDDFHMGPGLTTRKNVEDVILGKRGKSLRCDNSVRELIIAPRREHSRKPDTTHERIERYVGSQGPFLELFARQSRPGWITLGDEATKFDPPCDGDAQCEQKLLDQIQR
jgi:N6-adenosine-specific RNA methylase IME4